MYFKSWYKATDKGCKVTQRGDNRTAEMLGKDTCSLTHCYLRSYREEYSLPPQLAPLCSVYSLTVPLSSHCQHPHHTTSRSELFSPCILECLGKVVKEKLIGRGQLETLQALFSFKPSCPRVVVHAHRVFFHACYIFKRDGHRLEETKRDGKETYQI